MTEPGPELDADSTALVLRRAFELAHVEPEVGLVIGRQTLAEIAAEVDLPPSAVAAALAERQLRVEAPRTVIDRLVGPDRVAVQRASTADEEEMRARALRWLETGHGLRPRIQADGVIVATKRRDVVGKVARAVRDAQGIGRLGRLKRIELVAIDVGETPGAVCVVADVSDRRRDAVLGGAAVTVGATVAVGAGAAVLSPLILLGLPVAAAAGVITGRAVHGSIVRDVQNDLEETLDGLLRDEGPPTTLGRAADVAASVLRRTKRPRLPRRS